MHADTMTSRMTVRVDDRLITPAVAMEMWARSEADIKAQGWDRSGGTRPLRRRLLAFVDDMGSGQWADSESLISVAHTGAILDGRHRIRAVIESGVSCRFLVKTDYTGRSPMQVKADQNTPRTAAEITGRNGRELAIARLLAKFSAPGRNSVNSISRIESIADTIAPQYGRLNTAKRAGVGQAAMAAAVCLAMWRFPADEDAIVEQYEIASLTDMSRPLWPAWGSVVRTAIDASRHTLGGHSWQQSLFVKASYALEPGNRRVSKVSLPRIDAHTDRLVPIVAAYIGFNERAVS